MIRIALYLIVIGLAAYGIAWLADLPGDVVITWQGMRIETSLLIFGAATLAAVAILILVWVLIRAIVRSPYVLSRFLRHRRGVRAYEAISGGLIAVGAGDVETAQKHAATVKRIAPGEPLALLLHAQSAQLAGDRAEAERVFRTMASRTDTKPLGLHGLFVEAHRRNDQAGAGAYAEEAARTAPSLGWASRAVLEARCRDRRLGRCARTARSQCAHARQGHLSPPARGAAHRARACGGEYRPRQRQGFCARSQQARAKFGAGGGAGRAAACRGRRGAQSAPHHRPRLARQSASGIGAGL